MFSTIFGVFIFLHGMIHFLYLGQCLHFFEMAPGMVWPDGSWLFSKLLGDHFSQILTAILLAATGLVFLISGVSLIFKTGWWRPFAIGAAVLSTLVFLLSWNGKLEHLDNQGTIGILINLGILAALYFWKTLP